MTTRFFMGGVLAFTALVAMGATAPKAQAQTPGSLTTSFTTNSGLGDNGTVYFDLQALQPGSLTITSLAVNAFDLPGRNFTLNVYTRVGTFSGFETTSVGWNQVATGAGVTAGNDVPALVDITDFTLGTNLTGIAIQYVNAQVNYNDVATNQTFSNADLRLTAGSSTSGLFSGQRFSPRIFSGTVNYTVNSTSAPEPGTFALLGLGLIGGLGGTRALRRRK